jgi:hypothetical protein
MLSAARHFQPHLSIVWLIVWLGLAGLTVALLLVMRSSWGKSRPLRKCVLLSLLAHLLLAAIAASVRFVSGSYAPGEPVPVEVVLLDSAASDTAEAARDAPADQPMDVAPLPQNSSHDTSSPPVDMPPPTPPADAPAELIQQNQTSDPETSSDSLLAASQPAASTSAPLPAENDSKLPSIDSEDPLEPLPDQRSQQADGPAASDQRPMV